MEQFRQTGEVLGSLKALMVLQDDIPINQRQCCLLLKIFTMAFNLVAEEIKQNLKLEEKNTKWKPLQEPMRELQSVFKEGEMYVRQCLDNKDWWGKAISLHQNKDSVEFHIHNLLSSFAAVIEAIEIAGEISGLDPRDMQRKRVMLAKKYDEVWNDPMLFQWRFGKQYLVPQEICHQFESAVKEDGWLLIEAIREKKRAGSLTKTEQRLGDLLLKKLNELAPGNANGKLPPSWVLLGSEDYQVRRRIGGGNQYKEIHWLGESFVLRHFFGDIESLNSEISTLLSLSHPNIVQYLCGFYEEEKKECFLIMELMNRDLCSHIKQNSSPRKRVLFPLAVVVDIMLQIARGMEFLHSHEIYVGDLNPTNILLKPRKSTEGFFHVKVSGFGLTSIETQPSRYSGADHNATDTCIWYAPEVLADHEQAGNASTHKYKEKADVYSFGMVCFELLTGKLPFEDGHLHGDQTIKNIKAGERPLFPSNSPKYLVSLTKKCWHADPSSRPSFSSICRILRYIKKNLLMNPYDGQPAMQLTPVDYFDLEAGFLKKYAGEVTSNPQSVSEIPFQMFAYRLAEKEKTSLSVNFKSSESAGDAASNGWDESTSVMEDPIMVASDAKSLASDMKTVYFDMKSVCADGRDKKIPSDLRSVRSEPAEKKILLITKPPRLPQGKPKIQMPPAKASAQPAKSTPWSPPGQSLKASRERRKLPTSSLSPSRRSSGQSPICEKS